MEYMLLTTCFIYCRVCIEWRSRCAAMPLRFVRSATHKSVVGSLPPCSTFFSCSKLCIRCQLVPLCSPPCIIFVRQSCWDSVLLELIVEFTPNLRLPVGKGQRLHGNWYFTIYWIVSQCRLTIHWMALTDTVIQPLPERMCAWGLAHYYYAYCVPP